MAKNKSTEAATLRPKIFSSTDEISQGVEKLRRRIVQVEELKKDGLPYRDALKVTTEYQLRDTILEIFGAHSPEFHDHQHYRIKVSSKAGVDETITLLQHFVVALEDKRHDLLGLRPHPTPVPEANAANDATSTPLVSAAPASPTLLSAPPPAPSPPAMSDSTDHGQEQGPQSVISQSTPTPVMADQHQKASPLPHEAERAVAPSSHAHPPRKAPELRVKDTPPLHPIPAATSSRIADVPAVKPAPDSTPASLPSSLSAPQHAAHETMPQQPMPVALDMNSPQPIHDASKTREDAPQPAATMTPARAKTGADTLAVIRNTCLAFHSVVRQLRRRTEDRPTLEVEDEVDVQDVLRAILCVQFEEIRTETWNPSYSEMPRTDLMLPEEGIVIVVKKTRQGVGAKTLTDQLRVDMQRYLSQPLCKTLVCFLYDPEGRIGNPTALEAALLRRTHDRIVEIVIAPK